MNKIPNILNKIPNILIKIPNILIKIPNILTKISNILIKIHPIYWLKDFLQFWRRLIVGHIPLINDNEDGNGCVEDIDNRVVTVQFIDILIAPFSAADCHVDKYKYKYK